MTGKIYATDWGGSSHGEVNLLEGGRNYGWPHVFGKCDGDPIESELQFCSDSNVVEPIIDWYEGSILSARPSDLDLYHGEKFPEWEGSLLVTTLLDGLHQLRLDATGENVLEDNVYLSPRVFPDMPGQLRSLCVSPEGRIFIGTGNQGEDYREGDNRIIEVVSVGSEDTVVRTPLVTRNVVTGLRIPWEILWGRDNRIWLTEREGNVKRVDPETGEVRLLLRIPGVLERMNNGLLGMALHPNFVDSPYVYLVYSYQHPEVAHRILQRLVRYEYHCTTDTLLNPMVLIDSIEASAEHMGSRVVITPDRHILITTGDADGLWDPQGLDNLSGKVLRINIDGTIPQDNPWIDQPWPAGLVWSRGHRNPQGMVLLPDGRLYASEHGPWTDDEVNRIRGGADYGWPSVEGYCNLPYEIEYCSEHDIAEPAITWTPTIAPCGLDYYDHDAIPEWKGGVLMGTLKHKRLLFMRFDDDGERVTGTEEYFPLEYGRIRDLCIAPDGRVFLATSNHDRLGVPAPEDDRIIEIRSANGHPPLPSTERFCDPLIGRVADGKVLHSHKSFVPHPVVTRARMELGLTLGAGTIRIIDAAGAVVRREAFAGGSFYLFDRKTLPSGVYLVEIADDDRVVRGRVVVR